MSANQGYSQAQNKATQKYVKNNYDTITVRVPKGRREEIATFAERHGFASLNGFIVSAIERYISEL